MCGYFTYQGCMEESGMQIRQITVNAANLAQERGIDRNFIMAVTA